MSRVLVVYAHPVDESFVAAIRDRVLQGLVAGRHEVDLIDLYAEGFEPRLSVDEHAHHRDGLAGRPAIADHATKLQSCDTLVLVHPTWWGAHPAILKGWFDRVWTDGVAYTLPDGSNRIRGRLRNIRRIVTVTTHGSTKWVNSLQGEPGKRLVGRGLRVLCARSCRVKWVSMYGIDSSTFEQRSAFLDRVERVCSRL